MTARRPGRRCWRSLLQRPAVADPENRELHLSQTATVDRLLASLEAFCESLAGYGRSQEVICPEEGSIRVPTYPTQEDHDRLAHLLAEVNGLCQAIGFGVLPRLEEAGLAIYSPSLHGTFLTKKLHSVAQQDAYWQKLEELAAQAKSYQSATQDSAAKATPAVDLASKNVGPAGETARVSVEQTSPAARAIALMLDFDHRGRRVTVKKIVSILKCSRSTLYRDPQFQATRKALKARRQGPTPPHGYKEEQGTVEARYEEGE